MPGATYIPVATDEDEKHPRSRENVHKHRILSILGVVGLIVLSFSAGFGMGETWGEPISRSRKEVVPTPNGQLPPQSFFPDIPIKEVQFQFPTDYGDTGDLGDRLWKEMMPLGAGFLRVPFPRMYDMPSSKLIPGDYQLAEIYSMSITHQLHCLAVLRHVIMKYEVHSKSRFAGDGHEYHCLDYIRQAILCAGDTTLDHAEGSDRKSGFSGAGATHQCRDWEAIKAFAVEMREGNMTGILG